MGREFVAPEELLWEWCREGWKFRRLAALSSAEKTRYGDRVKREMDLIIDKGFASYFLMISELVRWAKNNGIAVGPARGSSAASLVCWLLRISEVNPMLFSTLLFERFIDPNRHDLPDIDLDFDDERRWEIRQHLVDRYGEDRVGNLGTFTRYKGKNSLDDIARVYQVPFSAVAEVKEMIIERSSGDLRGSSTIEDSVAMFPKVAAVFEKYPELLQAIRLEGDVKGMSVHAAGLVVANEPLADGVAVYSRVDSKSGERASVLSIDKYDAEEINALKIDALGLKTMGMISRCLEMIGMTLDELYAILLDDPEVYAAFQRNEVIGIFQFDGRAMKSVNREVKPETFAELGDINALSRPGPLHSGAASEYIQVKHGRKKPERLHPIVDEITKWSQYQIVYQEQILQIVRELASFSWENAAKIRKLISKKQGEQAFQRMREEFLDGCAISGVKTAAAEKIWKMLVTAGAYAFNSAHSISYAMIAYWTMWLKVNHPLEFYCASLQKYDPKTKGFDLLREATAKDIPILPPSPATSAIGWSVDGDGLRAGLTQVAGIGEKMAGAMLEYREKSGVSRWSEYLEVRGIGPKKIQQIVEFCAQEDPFGVELLSRRLGEVRKWIWDQADFLPFPRHRSEDIPYEAKRGAYTWIGAVRERNLKDLYELHRSRTGEELDPDEVKEPDHVNWVVLTGEDETGPLTITVARWGGLYERYKDLIWGMRLDRELLLVRGVKRLEYRRAIYAEQLFVVDVETRKVRFK